MNTVLRLNPRLFPAALLCAGVVAASTPALAAGPHALLPEDEQPATWSMSPEALRAQGLGQYRGTAVPVPAHLQRERSPDDPVAQQQGVIFVNFDGAMLAGGPDDARNNVTQIGNLAGSFAPYGDGDKRNAVMQAVAQDWSSYNVVVTQNRPASGEYVMNMTGPTNPFGGNVLGIAPLDCDDQQTHSNITFAFHSANDQFSAAITATTIGQEVAHSFGLEHVDEPNDIMNPFNAGGDPSFIDQCIQIVQGGSCGSQHQVHCGSPVSQNAHQELLTFFGPSTPDTVLPTVQIVSPVDGDEFDAGADFEIMVTANDAETGIDRVQLYNNGAALQSDATEPYGWGVASAPAGTYELYVEAIDVAGNVAMSDVVTVYVGVEADDEGDAGADGDDGAGTGGSDGGDEPPTRAGADEEADGCSCRSNRGEAPIALILVGLLGLTGRRRD